MRWRTLLSLIGVGVMLAACTRSPTLTGRDAWDSTQEELRSAQHWQILAADTARQIAAAAKNFPNAKAKFYVEPLDPLMPFAKAFEQYLATELVAREVPVSLSRTGALRIHYRVDTAFHHKGINPPPLGVMALLGTGVWFLADKASATNLDGFEAAGLLLAADVAHNMGLLGQISEVVLTVSVVDGDQLMARSSSTYYVEGEEMAQFVSSQTPPPLLVREPDWADDPMPVRSFPVVSD